MFSGRDTFIFDRARSLHYGRITSLFLTIPFIPLRTVGITSTFLYYFVHFASLRSE